MDTHYVAVRMEPLSMPIHEGLCEDDQHLLAAKTRELTSPSMLHPVLQLLVLAMLHLELLGCSQTVNVASRVAQHSCVHHQCCTLSCFAQLHVPPMLHPELLGTVEQTVNVASRVALLPSMLHPELLSTVAYTLMLHPESGAVFPEEH